MEDTTNTSLSSSSSTTTTTKKEMTAQGTPFHCPAAWSFNEAIRAILRCLGLEKTEFQQNPSSPKKEDDGKVVNHSNNQADRCQESPAVTYTEEGADPPSTADSSDPVTDPSADPPSTTGDPPVVVSFSTPVRPGTRTGSGPQIN